MSDFISSYPTMVVSTPIMDPFSFDENEIPDTAALASKESDHESSPKLRVESPSPTPDCSCPPSTPEKQTPGPVVARDNTTSDSYQAMSLTVPSPNPTTPEKQKSPSFSPSLHGTPATDSRVPTLPDDEDSKYLVMESILQLADPTLREKIVRLALQLGDKQAYNTHFEVPVKKIYIMLEGFHELKAKYVFKMVTTVILEAWEAQMAKFITKYENQMRRDIAKEAQEAVYALYPRVMREAAATRAAEKEGEINWERRLTTPVRAAPTPTTPAAPSSQRVTRSAALRALQNSADIQPETPTKASRSQSTTPAREDVEHEQLSIQRPVSERSRRVPPSLRKTAAPTAPKNFATLSGNRPPGGVSPRLGAPPAFPLRPRLTPRGSDDGSSPRQSPSRGILQRRERSTSPLKQVQVQVQVQGNN
ncbi:hypothetical protein F4808DRAFT_443556 [Astrocystis sublimbata]|nr:hypothetical protein F4808DRAFT_443556 [Astrocystis sublimbata]